MLNLMCCGLLGFSFSYAESKYAAGETLYSMDMENTDCLHWHQVRHVDPLHNSYLFAFLISHHSTGLMAEWKTNKKQIFLERMDRHR